MKNNQTDDLNRNEIRERVQNAIRDYVNSCNKKREAIVDKKQIIDALVNDNKTYGVANPTLYRYLKDMNCKEIAPGKFDFVDESNLYPFNTLLTYEKYNKFLCYMIDDPCCGTLIANTINDYYEANGMDDIFHCTVAGDILICFYYYKKNEENILTRDEIRKDIKKFLKKGCICFTD